MQLLLSCGLRAIEASPNRQGKTSSTKEEGAMANFKMKGNALFDKSGHKLATVKGTYIYDHVNRKVAAIKGECIYDAKNRKVATVKGSNIYDEHNRRIAAVEDVRKAIEGAMGGATVVALWLFFIR